MIFADASALISIIAQEEDAEALFGRLETAERRFYSAVARWETIIGLHRIYHFEHEMAVKQMDSFAAEVAIESVSIGEREFLLAIDAARDYGRGVIQRRSTWATALFTHVQRAWGRSCCTRETISL